MTDMINFDQIATFLNENTKDTACPQCRRVTSWAVQYLYEGEEGKEIKGLYSLTAAALPDEGNESMVNSYMHGRPVIPVICFACGFMKIFDYETVHLRITKEPYVDEKTKPEDDE